MSIRFVVLLLVLSVSSAAADGDCKGNHPCPESNVDVVTGLVGGDTSSLAFGRSSFDVDIAQCMGSTSWDTIIVGKQKLVLNHACMAEFYLERGRYDLAAQSLCNIPEELAEYSSEADCELDHDFTPVKVALPTSIDLNDAVEEQVQIAQIHHEKDVESLEGRLSTLEAGRRAAQKAAAEEAQYKADLITRIQGKDENDSEN